MPRDPLAWLLSAIWIWWLCCRGAPGRRLFKELHAATLEVWLEVLRVLCCLSRPFVRKQEACQWLAAFVDWYIHEHRHSAQAPAICQQRMLVYELARVRHPRRLSR